MNVPGRLIHKHRTMQMIVLSQDTGRSMYLPPVIPTRQAESQKHSYYGEMSGVANCQH